jgi:predicted NBD/HSP70 family sugar kinase
MYFTFDVGGTKTRIVGSRDLETFVDYPVKIDTPQDFDEFVEVFCESVNEMADGEPVEGVAGGITGVLNKEKNCMELTRLKSFAHKNISAILGSRLNTKVFINNDTAIVGLGEAHFGAGKDQGNIVVYITVSTGVGGVRIIDGKIVPSTYNFEIGHQIIDVDRTLCPESIDGTLEGLVSGTATEHRFGIKPYEVKDASLWNEQLPQWLAYGLYNTTLHWSPDVIVLGGSMIIGDPAISVPATGEKMNELNNLYPAMPQLLPATLGDFGGLHGGFAYLKQQL